MRKRLVILPLLLTSVLASPGLAGQALASPARAEPVDAAGIEGGSSSRTTAELRTGFERRTEAAAAVGGAAAVAWTTFDEEQAFLAAVDEASDKVRVTRIGETLQGRPIQLVQVGGSTTALEEVAEGRAVLFTCSQHGDEPAGREGCLKQIRDLASSADPRVVDSLAEMPVFFIPTANPDGREANTRTNTEGIDVNRDHLDPVTREAVAIQTMIRDLRPDVVADMHEFGGRTPYYDPDLLALWPRNRNVDGEAHDLSVLLTEGYVRPGAEAAGFSSGVYGIYTFEGQDIAQVAGDGDERILRNVVGLRNTVGLLVETLEQASPDRPEEARNATAVQVRRVATQVQAITDVLRFQGDNAEVLAGLQERAAGRVTAAGAASRAPFYFGGQDNVLPPLAQVALDQPCGYRLTAEQVATLGSTLALHGVEVRPSSDGGAFVSMAQDAQPLIPLLLDRRALYSPVDAEELQICPA